MKNVKFIKAAILSTLIYSFTSGAYANYWLVIGTYRQGPGGRPEVSGITSPSIYSLPMKDLETCKIAGNKITEDIYRPVWQFDSKWTCVYGGS